MKKEFSVKKLWKRNQIMITALALMIAIAGYLNFTGKQIDEDVLFTTSAQFEEADAETVEETMNNNLLEDATVTYDETSLYDISDEDDTYYTEIESLDEDFDVASMEGMDEEEAEMFADADLDMSDETMETNAESASAVIEEIPETEQADSSSQNVDIPGEAVFTNTMSVTSLAEANLIKEQTRAQNKAVLLDIINNENVSEAAKQDAINSMIALTDVAQKECDAMVMLQAKGFSENVVSINGEYADVCIGMNELSQVQIAQIEDIVKRKTGIPAENITISPVGQN
ncbi:MAG: SpoIIIAH-like family protein [Lachnospiraceae bacterium]|nr:SpoIIIAH-like family protein [Lachnospiraceae bacterium]